MRKISDLVRVRIKTAIKSAPLTEIRMSHVSAPTSFYTNPHTKTIAQTLFVSAVCFTTRMS